MKPWMESSRLELGAYFCGGLAVQWNRLDEEMVSIQPVKSVKNLSDGKLSALFLQAEQ